jgi:flagellar L-ring protein precursor FlgH
MIHWGTPLPSATRNPYVHIAIAQHRRARTGRRVLVACLYALPLLLLLVATVGAQAPRTAAPPPPPAAADSASARPAIASWTSDRRAFAVGDIITVLIDEHTAASANRLNTATDTKRRRMDAGADIPMEMSPEIGKRPNVGISSSNEGSSNQRGEATRGTRFVGEMSVRVVAVSTEGNLQVRGQKLVDVDKNKQQLTLSGWIRPQDVSARETVESSRIADAQLVYTQKGSLGKPRGGILTRILGVFWP